LFLGFPLPESVLSGAPGAGRCFRRLQGGSPIETRNVSALPRRAGPAGRRGGAAEGPVDLATKPGRVFSDVKELRKKSSR
jgi:hypothetical protein